MNKLTLNLLNLCFECDWVLKIYLSTILSSNQYIASTSSQTNTASIKGSLYQHQSRFLDFMPSSDADSIRIFSIRRCHFLWKSQSHLKKKDGISKRDGIFKRETEMFLSKTHFLRDSLLLSLSSSSPLSSKGSCSILKQRKTFLEMDYFWLLSGISTEKYPPTSTEKTLPISSTDS